MSPYKEGGNCIILEQLDNKKKNVLGLLKNTFCEVFNKTKLHVISRILFHEQTRV